jgi:prolipoprotein diacylglyceryltransferase
MPIYSLHLFWGDVRTWTLVGQLPFLGFVIALYLGGRRQGWPWRAALVATAAFVAGLGVGTAFLPSVLGAVAGGIAVWFLAQRVLGLRQAPIATLTLGLVALIAVGRWGCLLNGCCFGVLTDLPWGVRYQAGSSPYFLHQSLGLLAHGARRSLSVHPYPAYESLGLLLWLPIAYWLSRRLRSKGSLLAFSAAFDLALRGFIDGKRAMINVWWALLGFWHGINLFQWVLLAAACSLSLLGLLFEVRARRTSRVAKNVTATVGTASRLWLVFAGLLLLGWVSDSGQTAFLHRALLVALTACVPALAIPRRLGLRLRARLGFGYAVAAALVLVLGIHVEMRAHATVPDDDVPAGTRPSSSAEQRTWLYDVDQRRGVMVRVGSDGDEDSSLERRENILGLPKLAARAKQLSIQEARLLPEPSALAPVEPEMPRRSHTWVGAGVHIGDYSSSDEVKTSSNGTSSSDSCSGNTYTTTTTHERQAMGGWSQVEEEIPHGPASTFWIGGRGGATREWQQERGESTDPAVRASSTSTSYSAYYLNLWGEYEEPEFAFGLAVLGNFGREQGITLYPGFHLRAGSPRCGFDIGYADRLSFLSQQSGHAGISVAIRRGDEIRFPDDLKARLFFGLFFFPGTDIHRFDVAPGFGTEIFVTPRVAVGFNTAIFVNQIFGGMHLRAAVGP